MALYSPPDIAVLRTLGEDGISGEIAVPANQTYTIFLSCPFPCTITGFSGKTTAGTLTAAVQVAGVSVANLSALAITAVILNATPTQFTTTAQVQENNAITIVVSAVAAAANFSYVVKYKRPNQP